MSSSGCRGCQSFNQLQPRDLKVKETFTSPPVSDHKCWVFVMKTILVDLSGGHVLVQWRHEKH